MLTLPYSRSSPAGNRRETSPALSTRELLQSIPASLRFAMGNSEVNQSPNLDTQDSQTSSENNSRGLEDGLGDDLSGAGSTGPPSNLGDEDRLATGQESASSPFCTGNPGVPSTNLPMAPANQRQWEQVANIITGDSNRFYAIVCIMLRTRHDLEKESARRLSENWRPSVDLGARIIKIMRQSLGCHLIDSYTNTENIMKKSASWKSESLPPGFGETLDDLTNHETFMTLFKAKLRHVRDEFRVILLTNIHVPSSKKNKTPLPVPDIVTLQGLLTRFFESSDSRTNEEINNSINIKLKAWLAYLRLKAAKYHATDIDGRKERSGRSHWDWVDEQLEKLRPKDRKHQKAFDVLVLVRDEGFFNGHNTWPVIRESPMFGVPTEEEVIQAIPHIPSSSN
ncbi:hypothetical protein DFH28DRAFT_1133901 [Melampsora americana]|nr:hypothetical protein DFH28DRAFT_1133901 [Melampsora americana]